MANPFAIVIDDAIFLSDYSVFLSIILLMSKFLTFILGLKFFDVLTLFCELLALPVSFSFQGLLIFLVDIPNAPSPVIFQRQSPRFLWSLRKFVPGPGIFVPGCGNFVPAPGKFL